MSFQPQSPTPIEPLDALADLEADFLGARNPPEVVLIQDPPHPIGKSVAFDFINERFYTPPGGQQPLVTTDIGTLISWMEKCLRTARGAHPIHPPGYGLVNPTELFGQPTNTVSIPQLEPRIRDALTFHPRIVDITDFDYAFDPNDEWVAMSFTVVLDDDRVLPVDVRLTVSDFTPPVLVSTVTGGVVVNNLAV